MKRAVIEREKTLTGLDCAGRGMASRLVEEVRMLPIGHVEFWEVRLGVSKAAKGEINPVTLRLYKKHNILRIRHPADARMSLQFQTAAGHNNYLNSLIKSFWIITTSSPNVGNFYPGRSLSRVNET
jgi:hypothetical protein